MYHYLPLHIGLIFSLAEGNKVAGIRDYPRLFRLAFPRKDSVKMKGRGGCEIAPNTGANATKIPKISRQIGD